MDWNGMNEHRLVSLCQEDDNLANRLMMTIGWTNNANELHPFGKQNETNATWKLYSLEIRALDNQLLCGMRTIDAVCCDKCFFSSCSCSILLSISLSNICHAMDMANINEWIQLQLEINTISAEYDTHYTNRTTQFGSDNFYTIQRLLIFWTWNFVSNENILLVDCVCVSFCLLLKYFAAFPLCIGHTFFLFQSPYKLFASFEFHFTHQYAISRRRRWRQK